MKSSAERADGIVENVMKKILGVAAILSLTAGAAIAQQQPKAPNSNPKGLGADVRVQAHAQHDSTDKGIGAEVSEQAKAQRTAPEPTPSPSPSSTATGTTPAGQ